MREFLRTIVPFRSSLRRAARSFGPCAAALWPAAALLGLCVALAVPCAAPARAAEAAPAVQAQTQAQAPATTDGAPAPAKALPDTPAATPAPTRVPVRVERTGTDALGGRLALALQETVAASPLFRVAGKDAPQIRVLLSTREEFAGRPGLGTVYAVTWVYSESETTLKYYLESAVGFCDAASHRAEAESLAARTASLADQYSYLLR
ncbi:MAG: hypothetical protein H0S85_07110 [Desulfovibrionaceae bacterium]|jgi:hypothetical protein|nr:hypothetical protein [Desulfovibrionaceae bacterium]